jgi:hypothetical protein
MFVVPCCLISFHCFNKPIEPVAPRWDVNLTVPVSNRTYTMQDLVDKDTNMLHVGPGSQIFLQTSAQGSPAYVGDRIVIDPVTSTNSAQLGPFALDPVPPQSLPVSIPGLVVGQPLPPVSRLSLPALIGRITTFRQVSLKSGVVSLRIRNNLPAVLTIDSTIILRDSAGVGVAAFRFSPAQIAPGTEAIAFADLAGKMLTSKVSLTNMSVSEPGGGTVPAGSPAVATLEATALLASSAVFSSVPRQTLVDNAKLLMPLMDSTRVSEVRIKSGALTIHLQSNVPMNMLFKIRFTQMFHPSGAPYTDSMYLSAGGIADRLINLGGLKIKSSDGGFLSSLQVLSTADLYEGSRGQQVQVRESDNVAVQVSGTTIVVDSAVGVVRPTAIAIDQSIAVNLGDFSRKFSGQMLIPAANLTLEPKTTIGLPMELDLALKAKNSQGRDVTLAVPVTKGNGNLGTIDFVPGDVGNFLSQFSGKFPDSIRVVGRIVLNPDYDTTQAGTVGSHCTFAGAVNLSIPLNLSIGAGSLRDTVAFGDTTGDGNSDYQKNQKLFNGINSGLVHIDIENGLPMQVGFTVTLLDHDRRPLLTIPQGVGDSLFIGSAAVSGGVVQSAVRSSRSIPLSRDEVQRFEPAQFVRYAVSIATPGTQPVSFRATDYVRVRIWTQLSEQVNP